ncbi:hypothetical protein BJ170DRAFT_147994 [Xylariales sp. AK1849]|nr:hypothetical protein BJ170DRAFT_147994 [Xylariales sp. AK1849]
MTKMGLPLQQQLEQAHATIEQLSSEVANLKTQLARCESPTKHGVKSENAMALPSSKGQLKSFQRDTIASRNHSVHSATDTTMPSSRRSSGSACISRALRDQSPRATHSPSKSYLRDTQASRNRSINTTLDDVRITTGETPQTAEIQHTNRVKPGKLKATIKVDLDSVARPRYQHSTLSAYAKRQQKWVWGGDSADAGFPPWGGWKEDDRRSEADEFWSLHSSNMSADSETRVEITPEELAKTCDDLLALVHRLAAVLGYKSDCRGASDQKRTAHTCACGVVTLDASI